MGAVDGLVAAVDELEIGTLDGADAEQAELFAPALAPAERVANVIDAGLDWPGDIVRSARAGRPRGARNKRTREWSEYILARYQSPLEFLAEAYSRPVDVLAAELGCDKLEAFKVQCAAAGKIAEYVHQKQPVAVNLNGNTAGTLVIVQSDPGQLAGTGPASMQLDGEFVEYQELSDCGGENSDGENSDD